MAITYKILGAKNSASMMFDWSTIYTVPTGKSAVISSISISNPTYGSGNIGVQIYSPIFGPTPLSIVPYNSLAVGSRVSFSEGWTLSEGDSVLVDDANDGFHYVLFGSEIDV